MTGAQILKVAIAYDQLLNGGNSHEESLSRLRLRPQQFAPVVINAMSNLEGQPLRLEARVCPISALEYGMVLQQDVRTSNGLLLVAKGQHITYPLLARLRNFLLRNAISATVMVQVPRSELPEMSPQGAKGAGV